MEYIAVKQFVFQDYLGKIPPQVKIVGDFPKGGQYARAIILNARYYWVARGLARLLNLSLKAGIHTHDEIVLRHAAGWGGPYEHTKCGGCGLEVPKDAVKVGWKRGIWFCFYCRNEDLMLERKGRTK